MQAEALSTKTEKALVARKRAADSGAVLVPILERLLEQEVIPETPEDFRFMDMLIRARALPRKDGVFSPSMLASCQRQVFFAKRGTEKHRPKDPQMNAYFLAGNFTHLRWQFALWKAHQLGMLELLKVPAESLDLAWEKNDADLGPWRWGVEVRVVDGDYGGTIDALVGLEGSRKGRVRANFVVDFKGVRHDDYMKTVRQGAKREYRQQIVGYGKLANDVLDLEPPIQDCLLVSENKSGPVNGGSPIALHETRIPIINHEGEVARRLRTLRHFDAKGETPPPECVSTLHASFQGCPFNRFCLSEVREVQRERERNARKRLKPAKVARPTREV